MIAVSLIGGLGNQMFQYAAGRSLALRHQTELVLNLRPLRKHPAELTPRAYGLDCFTIQARVRRLVRSRESPPAGFPARRRIVWRAKKAFARYRVLRQEFGRFSPEFFAAQDGTHLVGHWQSEAYFQDCERVIRDDFRFRLPPEPRNRELLAQIGECVSVSLHVRRGDYVNNQVALAHHGVLGIDYYLASLEEIEKRAGPIHAFVFSNDPAWCRAHLRTDCLLTFVEHNAYRPSEDLRLMSACRHHVVANSSFSWWGAWLDPRADKIVVAPRQWVRTPGHVANELPPSMWIRL